MTRILCETFDTYAILTLNKPARRNVLGTQTALDLRTHLAALAEDNTVRSVILTGAGKGFCAGSDLRELAALDRDGRVAHEAATAAAVRAISAHPVPVIAAVEGHALGGGFVLATACDVVVTGRSARWAMPEVPKGFFPPWGMAPLLARVGPARAKLIVLGIEEMSGEDAVKAGVADHLTWDEKALDSARGVATRIAMLPEPAVRAVKRFFGSQFAERAEALDAEASGLFAQDCDGPAARQSFARFK
ncbi:enoyl-CoA hydratase/isomerase family protein [Nioella aestuarii]|uniref:enoyl-CoA hydratase/isomerase family protein n=1 Tax=Nioella aestuarii TaxID=1662864 RepID=UPI003D7F942E